jgi:hypothetical protein
MSAGAAQGATLSWLILNSTHTTATELKAELEGKKDKEIDLTLLAELNGLPIIITCGNFSLSGVNLEVGGKLTSGGTVNFTECEVYKEFPLGKLDARCTVKSPGAALGTVTATGKGELVLHKTKAGVEEVLTKVEPLLTAKEVEEKKEPSKGIFTTIRLEGLECPYPEQNVVHGTLFLKDCQGFATTHKLEHLIEANAELTALYVGGHSAKQLEVTKVDGSALIRLKGAHVGLEWSAMDV